MGLPGLKFGFGIDKGVLMAAVPVASRLRDRVSGGLEDGITASIKQSDCLGFRGLGPLGFRV